MYDCKSSKSALWSLAPRGIDTVVHSFFLHRNEIRRFPIFVYMRLNVEEKEEKGETLHMTPLLHLPVSQT